MQQTERPEAQGKQYRFVPTFGDKRLHMDPHLDEVKHWNPGGSGAPRVIQESQNAATLMSDSACLSLLCNKGVMVDAGESYDGKPLALPFFPKPHIQNQPGPQHQSSAPGKFRPKINPKNIYVICIYICIRTSPSGGLWAAPGPGSSREAKF